MGTLGGCRGCTKGTESGSNAASHYTIYKIRPNYPVYLQDQADKKQCKLSCDPKYPRDETLKKCMSPKNVTTIKCTSGPDLLIDKIEFVAGDGTSVKSHDKDVIPQFWSTSGLGKCRMNRDYKEEDYYQFGDAGI